MTGEKKRKNLGRGLSALLGDDEAPDPGFGKESKTLPIEYLRPGRYQPRAFMDEDRIEELAKSIEDKGILQPLLVRALPDKENAYEIVAGERRWRAAQRARIHEVPVIVKKLSDREALEIALIENLQRQDLTAIDEASGLRRLMDEFGHTQERLARAVGKSRSHVANTLRLLSLPEGVRELVNDGRLSAGHARALVGHPEAVALARKAVKKGLNVRQIEQLVKKIESDKNAAGKTANKIASVPIDADTKALARDLTNLLGLNVDIAFNGTGGTISIAYNTLEQLDDILAKLGRADACANEFGIDPADLSLEPGEFS